MSVLISPVVESDPAVWFLGEQSGQEPFEHKFTAETLLGDSGPLSEPPQAVPERRAKRVHSDSAHASTVCPLPKLTR